MPTLVKICRMLKEIIELIYVYTIMHIYYLFIFIDAYIKNRQSRYYTEKKNC